MVVSRTRQQLRREPASHPPTAERDEPLLIPRVVQGRHTALRPPGVRIGRGHDAELTVRDSKVPIFFNKAHSIFVTRCGARDLLRYIENGPDIPHDIFDPQ